MHQYAHVETWQHCTKCVTFSQEISQPKTRQTLYIYKCPCMQTHNTKSFRLVEEEQPYIFRHCHQSRKTTCITKCKTSGKDKIGQPNKQLQPPPEVNMPGPPDKKTPFLKLLKSLPEVNLLFTNRFNIHRCSKYCLTLHKTSGSNTISDLCNILYGIHTGGEQLQICL